MIDQRKQLLAKMDELQKTLDLLDYKIDVYDKALLNKEIELIGTEALQCT